MKTASILAIALCSWVFCPTVQANPMDAIDKAQTLYDRGNYLGAIEQWRQAIPELQNQSQIAETHYKIGLAQRALGYPARACQSFVKAIDIPIDICRFQADTTVQIQAKQTDLETRTFISMANLLRDVGQLSQASEFLNFGIANAQHLNNAQLEAAAQLSQAKLMLTQLKLKRDRFAYQNIQEIPSHERQEIQNALFDAYQAAESAMQSFFRTDAIFHWFEIYEENQQWLPILKTDTLLSNHQTQINQYISELDSTDLPDTQTYQTAKFHLQRAKVLGQLVDDSSSQAFLLKALEANVSSLETARSIEETQLVALAYGQLATLYQSVGQFEDALQSLDAGIQYAASVENSKLLYQFHRDRASIYSKQGNDSAALEDYQAAIQNIQALGSEVTWLPSELRTEFQSEVQPVFEAYLALLLSQAQPEYTQILQVQDQFNRTLIQNYLGCSSLQNIALTDLPKRSQDTIISIIKAEGHYHTITFNQDKIAYSRTNADAIDQLLQQTHLLLSEDTKPLEFVLRQPLQNIYEKLLEPTLADIPSSSTLLFRSLDPTLQQLPMALLYDGQSYLVEKFPIALIGNIIYEPKQLDFKQSTVLFAGISNPDNFSDFSALLFVETEKDTVDPDVALTNEQFTKERFINRLRSGDTVVHVASHGQFSSTPEETFLLAWDEKITLNSINSVVSDRALNTPQPIELLVLSACETAKGDFSASLGLAGITVQAGARSTLASLWRAEDRSTALLMEDFYQFLRDGHSKAESLQLAQIEQIQQGQSPYFWGNFVLIGSWL